MTSSNSQIAPSRVDFSKLDSVLEKNKASQLEQLFELLRIPSVSADSRHVGDMAKAADWMRVAMVRAGLHAELIPGDGPPLVYAESPPVPGKPIVLVYGHYDVQPPDPLPLWQSPPFEPVIRDGNIVARGSTDDKGQMLTHLMAVAAWKEAGQPLPLQVKFIIEGQEEMGSAVFGSLLPKLGEKLKADVIVISDSSQFAKGQPAITYGLRGIAYYELRAYGPKADLHSGSFGGSIANPCLALAQLLAMMKDTDGRIQLPNFYDSVVPLASSERERWSQLPFSEEHYAAQLGVSALTGEVGYSTLERRWARPTFEVHGLMGGYQGEGAKTIIPSWAGAKISFRLVPNQHPKEITRQLEQFVAANTPTGVRIEVIDLHGGHGVVVDPDSPYMAAAQQAVSEGFGKPAVLIREGGSIPIVANMVELLKADVLLMGWGLDDDGAHSPNEKFSLEDFYRGIRSSSRLWQYLSEVRPMASA